MDVTPIIDGLNDSQREAVCAADGNVLVLAGAGSGKTRVLVHRIAWLIQALDISPYSILAVTFTNKAASEMRGRIENLLNIPARGLWVGTFHGLAHRLLRAHWQEANLPETFQIMDSDDQVRAIRRIIRESGLDENQYQAKQVQWFINARKDEGQRPQSLDDYGDPYKKQLIHIYQTYENFCQRSGLVDFAELLLRAHELWLKRPDVLQHYQQRFRHILVDEFQDTNTVQYAWLRMLAGKTGKIFIVGDDDQSIYGWRGAKIENIQKANRDFSDTTTVRLEQNYRSTGNILNAANALITHNTDRLGKNLWTSGADGEPVYLYNAFNDLDEARFVVGRIKQWVEEGGLRSQTAILYRSNAQSRVFEEALLQNGMPYRVYGGLRFFERQEIRDALAYLRLISNRDDDAAFERIVNTPTRGIGARSLEVVRQLARQQDQSMWQASKQVVTTKALANRGCSALAEFHELMDTMAEDTANRDLAEQCDHVIETSGLLTMYRNEKGEKGQTRVENLEELVNATREFTYDSSEDEEELSPLVAFLSHAALEAGEAQGDAWEDCVQLMTLHSAKGLEFPLVFMGGVEEGLFPHERSVEEAGRLEEERRLCYVGMTRAMQILYISFAQSRRLHGNEHYPTPSRFIGEIPDELLQNVRMRGSIKQPVYQQRQHQPDESQTDSFRLGQRVKHNKFGEGVVLHYEGNGPQARVQVNFDAVGSKWLVLAYANLQHA